MSQLFKSRSSPAKLSEKDLGESLRTAVIQNEAHNVRTLLKKISVDYVLDANRKTALYLASQHGHFKLVKTLLSHGASPNCRCVDGSTPVHAACYAGNLELMSLLISAGGDLRLHDNDGRGVRDWALKHIDKKKSRAMICHIEELYHKVMETKEDGESLGTPPSMSSQKKKLKYPTNSRNSVCLQNIGFGRVRRGQFTCPAQRIRLVEVASWSEEQATEPSLIPVINETSLVHDQFGVTFTNGPFMAMESMYWNQFITVTVKRLRKIPMEQESGKVDELINENNYMLRLKHANILLLLAVCPVDRFENIILVYERVEQGSLHTLLHHANRRFPRMSTISIFMQICDAILYLHQSNVIHSYISAHAIMIMSSSCNAKLTNFEYMVDSDVNDTCVLVNRTYPSAATNWLAPEILVDKRVSKKTDTYGVCVVLWEVLHGKLPFADLSASEIEILVMDAENRVLPIDASIDSPLTMILDSGLKCDPNKRSCKIKDIQNLLDLAYADVKSDKPLQLHKKQAKNSFFETLSVQCKEGCLLYCDENYDLAELPKPEHHHDLIEQREWRNKSRGGMLEQREPSLTSFKLENAPEALRHSMSIPKITTVRKLFKDYAGCDEDADSVAKHGKAPVDGNEIRERLLLLDGAQIVGGEGVAFAASDEDLVEAEGVLFENDQIQDEGRTVQDLGITASEQSRTDVRQSSSECANAVLDESGETDVQTKIKEKLPDTEESSVTDTQTDSEDGVTSMEETRRVAKRIDYGGERGKTAVKLETEETITPNLENISTLGPGEKFKEKPLNEIAALNISPINSPVFAAALGNRETKNVPSSFSGVDVSSTDQVPSFPVSEELIVPVIIPPKKILDTFQKNEVEGIRESATPAAVGSQNSREAEPSNSTQQIGIHVRRSIQLLKSAFFSNSNLAYNPDPISSTSAMTTAQTKKSSSDVSLQRPKQPSATVNNEIQVTVKASKPDQPVAAVAADDQLLPKLSGELTANSIEKFKDFINKPLPPLPRAYIKQTQEQKQKAAANSVFTSSEFDSAAWQRLSYRETGANNPLWFPCGRETRTGYNAYVTSRAFGLYVPTAVSHSGPSELPQSGSASNLSQQRLGSSNDRVLEAIQTKTESPVLSDWYSQVGLYSTHVGASKMCDKSLAEGHCRSPPARNLDFMTGFKPASHHVPSMVAAHLSKRTTGCLIAQASIMPQRMRDRLALRQDDFTISYIGYRLGKDLQSGIRKVLPFSGNDSPLGEVVTGRLEKEIIAVAEERAPSDVELENDPTTESKGMSSLTEATFPKLFALSTQAFRSRLGSDGPRAAVRSAQVISGRGVTEDVRKKIDVSIEEVMGDNQIVTSKENDLEVLDTRNLEVHMPNAEPASHGHRTLPKLAAMKAGTSLTIPPSARVSELQDEADFMHRFKSDPLLQRDALMKLGDKTATRIELDKTSEEFIQMQQQGSVPSSMNKNADIETEKSNISQGFAVSDGDHAKLFKTSALLCFQVKPAFGSPGSRTELAKEMEEGISARDEVSCLVESAIVDALDQIAREYLVSRCPHKANSTVAGL